MPYSTVVSTILLNNQLYQELFLHLADLDKKSYPIQKRMNRIQRCRKSAVSWAFPMPRSIRNTKTTADLDLLYQSLHMHQMEKKAVAERFESRQDHAVEGASKKELTLPRQDDCKPNSQ